MLEIVMFGVKHLEMVLGRVYTLLNGAWVMTLRNAAWLVRHT